MSEFVVVHKFRNASGRECLGQLVQETQGARALNITIDGGLTIFKARHAETIARLLQFWHIPYERILSAEAVASGQNQLHSQPRRRRFWLF